MSNSNAPLTPKQLASLRRRFFAKVRKTRGCWLWTAGIGDDGYGFLQTTGTKKQPAHRVAWLLHRGEIPDGLWVLHSCDNRPCVNPRHLFLGNQQTNTKDMVLKNRQAKGCQVSTAKLTDASVAAIFQQLLAGDSQTSLARKFNVSIKVISAIYYSHTWKHIKRPLIACAGHPRGQANPAAKLRDFEAASILQQLQLGAPVRSLARSYKVSQRAIQFIRDNKTWKHIPRFAAPSAVDLWRLL